MKVLIADKFDEHGLTALEKAGFHVHFKPDLKGDDLLKALRVVECEVLVVRSTRVTCGMMEACKTLRLVLRAGSGYDTIDVDAASERGINVCNCPGLNSVAVAELVMGLMIALDRRIVDETDDLRHGVWNKKEYSKARGLKGRRLGIVGLGRIGAEVAQRAAAFEMELLYTDTIDHPDVAKKFGIEKVDMETMLRRADFITLHVPGGPGTHHMIGAEELSMMQPTSFVINCSRGGVVDEAALSDAVKNGIIAGAALDVYEIEPAASDKEFKDPIGSEPHVYGTHHVGASTAQAQEAIADEVVKILCTFADTGRVINCVNQNAVATGGR
ncbi:MAG: NAD(P)-dependent oxidoreductase [Planctomycetota bacterium]|jgi:D-3-phosphoglycerate dehydrogenase